MGLSSTQALIGFGLLATAIVAAPFIQAQLSAQTGVDPTPTGQTSACGEGISEELCGKDGTVKTKAMNREADSSTQVGVGSIYAWEVGDSGVLPNTFASGSGSASSTTDFTYGIGATLKFIAFGDTYEYGAPITVDLTQKTQRESLDVYEAASSSDLSLTMYDENGDSTTSVSLGADQEYSFEKFRVEVSASNKAYNPKVVAFSKADNGSDSNVSSIDMPDAEEIAVPDAFPNSYDTAFVVYDANQGEPLLHEWDHADSGNIVVTADGDGTNGETLRVGVADAAPYIGKDDTLKWGVQDDTKNPSFTGVGGPQTKDITLN